MARSSKCLRGMTTKWAIPNPSSGTSSLRRPLAMPKIFIAADHAGFALKKALAEHIRTLGYDVVDVGAFTNDPEDDYPDVMTPLAKKVVEENARGIMIGGS